jgi:hypothetical protein
MAIILVYLLRFVLPTTRSLFCQREAVVYERLANIDLAPFIRVFDQPLGNALENVLPNPLLEAPMVR